MWTTGELADGEDGHHEGLSQMESAVCLSFDNDYYELSCVTTGMIKLLFV